MNDEHYTKLVIIVSDGPLFAGTPITLVGRSAIHIPVASPPLRAAALATTAVTGVSPLVHGIVTKNTVDDKTLQIRETQRSDRRFQTFWDDTDLNVKLINWVATLGDPQVTKYTTTEEFEKAKECLDADILGILLPRIGRESPTSSQVQEDQHKLESFLNALSPNTHVLLLHRRTNEDGSKLESLRVFGATFLVNDYSFESNTIPHLELVGAATYLLAGLPCPAGVKQPEWPFLQEFKLEIERPFPAHSSSDETDWNELIKKLVDSKDSQGITLISQRFITMTSVAFKKELWEEVEFNSYCLIQLQGKPFEFWMLILALEQLGKVDLLQSAIDTIEKQYPDIFITSIAKCLLQFDPDKRQEALKKIDITKVGIYHAIGLYGRLCLKAGLIELGKDALELAIRRGVAISADRAQLAKQYYEAKQYEKALHSLRSVGVSKGELTWQVLRLKILVALNLTEEAKQMAQHILEQEPTQEDALSVIGS